MLLLIRVFLPVCPQSGGPDGSSDSVGASLTSALAMCLDDIGHWNMYAGSASLVTVIAATNEPWCVDAGFLRPGRFDRKVFVGPLDVMGRYELLKKELLCYRFVEHTTQELRDELLMELAHKISGRCTGADIALFVKNIKLAHFRDNEESVVALLSSVHHGLPAPGTIPLAERYVWDAVESFVPSVSQRDLGLFQTWGGSYSAIQC